MLCEGEGEKREKSRTGAGGRTGFHSKGNCLPSGGLCGRRRHQRDASAERLDVKALLAAFTVLWYDRTRYAKKCDSVYQPQKRRFQGSRETGY